MVIHQHTPAMTPTPATSTELASPAAIATKALPGTGPQGLLLRILLPSSPPVRGGLVPQLLGASWAVWRRPGGG